MSLDKHEEDYLKGKAEKNNTPKCWTTGIKRVDNCGLMESEKDYVIYLPYAVHRKVQSLSAKMNNLEWLGYLTGSKNGDDFRVKDIEIPKQDVTTASVFVVETAAHEGIIGTIHLHPFASGTFFSATDEKHIGGNHPMMIVTTPKSEYKAAVKVALPCGASTLVEAKVILLMPRVANLDGFVEEAKEKIVPLRPKVYVNQLDVMRYTCNDCNVKMTIQEAHWRQGGWLCDDCFDRAAGK